MTTDENIVTNVNVFDSNGTAIVSIGFHLGLLVLVVFLDRGVLGQRSELWFR
jgi:hypothetical protein